MYTGVRVARPEPEKSGKKNSYQKKKMVPRFIVIFARQIVGTYGSIIPRIHTLPTIDRFVEKKNSSSRCDDPVFRSNSARQSLR